MYRTLTVAAGLTLLILLACIVVPDYLHARNRSRQKRTMADIRTIATAWEARATSVNSYSVGAARSPRVSARPVTTAELALSLEPTYVRSLPGTDGWDTAFQLTTGDDDAAGQAQTYVIRSLGSDRRPDRIANLTGSTTSFEDDIVYSNGSFVRFPESAG
jgi:hypothetical protein